MTTPGKIPKNISRKKKNKKIIFKNIFSLSSHAISLAGLDASALWPAHPSDLLRLISSDHSQLIASDSLQLLSSGTMPAHRIHSSLALDVGSLPSSADYSRQGLS